MMSSRTNMKWRWFTTCWPMQSTEIIPLAYGIALPHIIGVFISGSFDSNGFWGLRKSHTYTDSPMVTIISRPESDMDVTSESRLFTNTDFLSLSIRVSQANIFLSKPAVITWPIAIPREHLLTIKLTNKVIAEDSSVQRKMVQSTFVHPTKFISSNVCQTTNHKEQKADVAIPKFMDFMHCSYSYYLLRLVWLRKKTTRISCKHMFLIYQT